MGRTNIPDVSRSPPEPDPAPEPGARLPVAALAPRRSAVDACADALREAILAGRLAAGARLPPERALAEQLGVNRVTLRSALGRLAAEHLLSARQGSGHVVLDYRRLGGPELFGSLLAAAPARDERVALAEDLLAVRRALARVVLGHLLAAPRAALAPVRDAIARFVEVALAPGAREEAVAAADLAVLRALLDATGRPALQLFWNPVLTVLADSPRLRAAMYADPAANARGWRALDALLAGPQRDRPKPADAIARLDDLLRARDLLVLRHLREGPP
ncbi:MAG: GntR family transcriptional regulator [Deltaproteobacteria bacterium]|nr:GntR family transcriptional regulator [Deltaproteobacteria bacterium]